MHTSIAQVYKAKFRGEDEYVAIKVRHPQVEERLLLDFQLLNGFANALDHVPLVQWMGLKSTLTQFGHTLGAQVRLDFEAINLQRFHANFRACPQIMTAFPLARTDIAHMSADILIESYEPGHSVAAFCLEALQEAAATVVQAPPAATLQRRSSSQKLKGAHERGTKLVRSLSGKVPQVPDVDLDALVRQADAKEHVPAQEGGGGGGGEGGATEASKPLQPLIQPLSQADATHVVRTGKETYLQMLLADNFIHADMHPGNILLRTSACGTAPPTLVLIDAGMVDVMSPEEQDNFIGVFQAMGAGDGDKAARHLMRFSNEQVV